MPIKKFVLIKCENSNCEEIIRSKKIYVQTPVAGSFNHTQLTELEYIDGNNQFVLFNQQKKAIEVAILANEDTEEALLPLCCNEKRPTRRKNFSESPVATKMSKRVVNKTEQDDCNEEKKRLSLAKNSVIESSDGLYLSDTDESDEENNRAGTSHQELSMVVNPVSSKLRGKKSTISIGQKKDKSQGLVLDLSAAQKADDSRKKLPVSNSTASATITSNDSKKRENLEKFGFDDESIADFENDEGQGVTTSSDRELNRLPEKQLSTSNDGKIDSDGENSDKTFHHIEKDSLSTSDKNKKTVVVAGYRLEETCYNKARSAKNISSRLSSIMNGYWTDEQASKYCLKARSDKAYLKEISAAELLPIEEMFNAINENAPLKLINKKKIKIKLDEEIRNCASNNFKARRKKVKSANKDVKPPILKLSNKYQDVSEIDNAIKKLMQAKEEIKAKKQEKEKISIDNLKAKEEELVSKELELKRKEEELKKREDEWKRMLQSMENKPKTQEE